jgi:acyl-ACP--UDP-N-acetylglucosamine O-acyltransferase
MFWHSRKSTEISLRYENAYIHPTAEIGADVEIGPFTYVGPNSRIGDGTRLHNHVTLVANVVLGQANEIFPGAVLGAVPQDKKYKGEESWVILGDSNTIRECVTINSGTALGGGLTRVGNRNLIMASCHIAHDCILEDEITMANNVLLGGHVKVEDRVGFGGLAAVHHFVTVGQHAFVGGLANADAFPRIIQSGTGTGHVAPAPAGGRRHMCPRTRAPSAGGWGARLTSFSGIAGAVGRSMALSDGTGEPERFAGAAISWNLFPMLGVPPALGRPFGPEDDRPGAEPVAIVSDAVWQRRYQGDPALVGRQITINARPHTVVGVMPPRFGFPNNEKVWIPLAPVAEGEPRNARTLLAYGRLAPGASLAAAQTELTSVASAIGAEYPLTSDGWGAAPRAIEEVYIPSQVRLVLLTMMGAVTIVLLIACANVANLMLARASGRQREFCVRAALGAGRAQLIKQLLTECVLLGLASAPLGLAIAYVGVWMLDNAVPPGMVPYYIHWEISPRVITYTLGVSALTGLVFGLAPALQAGRLNLQEALRDGARGSGQSGRRARLRNGLVVLEVALSLVLLVGASLFVRSFLNLQSASPGFETAPLLTARFFMVGEAYATAEQKAQRVEDVMRRIESLPGVTSAFASNFVPLDAGGGSGHAIVDGRAVPKGEEPTIL